MGNRLIFLCRLYERRRRRRRRRRKIGRAHV